MPRDYFQLRPDGLRWLAYPDRYVFELVQDIEDIECGQKLTEEDETRLFSAMITGADLVYPLESHRLAWLMWKILDCWQASQETDCGIYYDEDEKECGDDMTNRTMYQKFNDVWYVGFPCGCGEVEWVELGRGAALGSGGGPQLPGDDNWFDEGNVADESTASCFANGAVSLITPRLQDFADTVIDVAVSGLDIVSGGSDELFNIFMTAAQLLSGDPDLGSIADFSKAQITDALTDTTVQARLKAAWTFRGEVSRSDLQEWSRAGEEYDTGTGKLSVTTIISTWARFVNVRRLNNDLSVTLANCETEVESETPFFNAGVISGDSYYLATVGLQTLQSGNERKVLIPAGGIVVGWAWFNQNREFVPPGALCDVSTSISVGGVDSGVTVGAEFINDGFYIQVLTGGPTLTEVQNAFPSIAGATGVAAPTLAPTDGDLTWQWTTSGASCNPGDVFQAEQSISVIVRGTPPS